MDRGKQFGLGAYIVLVLALLTTGAFLPATEAQMQLHGILLEGITGEPESTGLQTILMEGIVDSIEQPVIIEEPEPIPAELEALDWDLASILEEGISESVEQKLRVKDSKGRALKAVITVKDNAGRIVPELSLAAGEYDVSIELEEGPVKSIEIRKIALEGLAQEFIDVDDVPETGKFEQFVEVYAIDPTKANFTEATVTVVATGTELYKCADWDFSAQSCLGEWALFKTDLMPGEEYTFTLTAEDPGFGEINITKAVHLDENKTLTDKEVDKIMERLTYQLEKQLNASIRK